jgi:hypothetical protein
MRKSHFFLTMQGVEADAGLELAARSRARGKAVPEQE